LERQDLRRADRRPAGPGPFDRPTRHGAAVDDADETLYVIDGELTVFAGDERIKAGRGDFVFVPMGLPHAFLVTSERAETLITCSPAGIQGPAGFGIAGFFRDVAVPVVPGRAAPDVAEADPEELARKMARYGIELVGPPPTLD
jgi:hypothetical protein